jgi:hypothetical protein
MRALVVVAGLFAAGAVAQSCLRPVPPSGGHATNVDLLVPVTYSDGYQTFGSMILPVGAPPSCGWPLVVFVHPYGQSRGFDLGLQTFVAAQGYAVWNFDVRAHGQAVAVNPTHPFAGSTLWGPIERFDLAEQILFVGANPTWASVVDAGRVAVVGSSMGGAHAWNAAAWSGQPIVAPGRIGILFPPVACVVAADLVADPVDDWLRGGRMFSAWFVEAISGSYTGVAVDPAFLLTCRNAFVAQDPGALVAAFAAEQRGMGTHLQTSMVPVLHSHAYHDNVAGPLSAVARGEARAAVHRLMLGTIGHGVPGNVGELAAREAMFVRWLNRYLWNVPNEVDLEARCLLAEMPATAAERTDPAFAWSHAFDGALTTPPTASRLYLHDDYALRSSVPTVAQADAEIAQVVDPLATDFTALDYLNQPNLRTLPSVLARCPLQDRVWTFVVGDEAMLTRSATVHLRVEPDGPHWMLAALLTVEAPGTGEEVMLATNALASVGSVSGIVEEHDLRLSPVAMRLPAGSLLRLHLRNLWLREAPMVPSLEVAPFFHDFRVDVQQGGVGNGSWLDVPLELSRPRLAVLPTQLELATPAPIVATLRGGAPRGGYPYFAMVGLSGHAPVIPYLNDVIPIDADWLVLTSAAASPSPLFTGFLGFLDANGNTTVTFALGMVAPLPHVLNGLSFTLGAFVWDGPWAPTGAATPPCDVLLR